MASKPKHEQIKKEDVKQAVVVDYKAYGCKVPGSGPVTKPYIQYSLEWLHLEGFHEVYVCCLPDNAKQIREFVENFLLSSKTSMLIQVHSSENNRSTGDCLRDLDGKNLIKTDFVIMDVGCCGNLPLAELLEAHKSRKKTDKNAIITSVVRNVFTKNPAEIGEFPIYITDPKSGLLLHYVAGRVAEDETPREVDLANAPNKSVAVPTAIFLERGSVKIHTNLSSTNLSIYSTNVPLLYAELFDSHSEAELIQAAFDNHEVLGGTIYIHITDDLFSQRMADFGFAINQKSDKFDTELIYKRNEHWETMRQFVNDSLIDCTRLNTVDYLKNLEDESDSDGESESESEQSQLDDEELFLGEVLDSLVGGYEEATEYKNLILEVNASKHAYNININDVSATIGKALLLLPEKLTGAARPKTAGEYSKVAEASIQKLSKFLLNYMDRDESKKCVLSAMEDLCISGQVQLLNETVLARVIYKLYDVNAADEDSILDWFNNYDRDDASRTELRTKPALQRLAEVLQDEDDDDE